MTQHTPAPWEASNVKGDSLVHSERGDCIAWCNAIAEDIDNDANARLIAAAPMLLTYLRQGEEVLSGLEAEIDSLGIESSNMSDAREWWSQAGNLIQDLGYELGSPERLNPLYEAAPDMKAAIEYVIPILRDHVQYDEGEDSAEAQALELLVAALRKATQ